MDADELAEIQTALLDVISEASVSITLRRGGTALAAQSVRIGGGQGGRRAYGTRTSETRADVVIGGPATLDIQIDDEFNLDDSLYRVLYVHPNRMFMTRAEAQRVQ